MKKLEKGCNEYRIRKAKAAKQVMAPLTKIRLRLSLRVFAQMRPFYHHSRKGNKEAEILLVYLSLVFIRIHS